MKTRVLNHLTLLALLLLLLVACGKEPVVPETPGDSTYHPGEVPTHPGPACDTLFEVGGIQFRMRYVASGTYYMGASADAASRHYDAEASDNESPVHQVTLSSFLIGECEVTQALYLAVMGSNPSENMDLFLPVQNVSMTAAQRFIDSLRVLTGFDFRLPTEAEWEYAARGGREGADHRYSGSDTADHVAWYGDNSDGTIRITRAKQPNALGLYDMSGNVMEWCSDWYGSYPSAPQTDPQGPDKPDLGTHQKHALRGGAYDDQPFYLRNTTRQFQFASYEGPDVGFRLVLSCR